MYKPYNLTLPLYNSICVTVNSTTRIIGTRGIHQRVKQFKNWANFNYSTLSLKKNKNINIKHALYYYTEI